MKSDDVEALARLIIEGFALLRFYDSRPEFADNNHRQMKNDLEEEWEVITRSDR